jgi:L-iditol 2-dehydrogenase
MQAIEFHGGERLELVERPDPEPGPGDLLIAPAAVGICGTDVE